VKAAKVLMGVLTAGSLVLGAGLALAATTESKAPEPAKTPAVAAPAAPAKASGEKEVAADRSVRGEVTAVETTAKTLTVKAMRNKKEDIIGVDVPDSAKITQGKAAKTLADIKVGDRVWMKYDRMSDKLVADQIHILPAQKAAAKKKSS
jgi:Cu/Ag efflux protein CusF